MLFLNGLPILKQNNLKSIQVTLSLNNRGRFITMIVEDNGHGFKIEDQTTE